MTYVISKEDLSHFSPVTFKHGKNSYFRKLENKNETFLLKFFHGKDAEIQEKINIIHHFNNIAYSGMNAFPIDTICISGEEKGYMCNYQQDALNFMEEEVSSLPYSIRYQAALDNVEQLKFIHNKGFIYNDMRLTNCMVSLSEEHGFLVDFEDMILENDFKIKQAYYRFVERETYQTLPPSKLEDVKKQFICNLSLLLNQNLEMLFIMNDERDIIKHLAFLPEIYKCAYEIFLGNDIIYFDEVAQYFKDEEKVLSYHKQLSKKFGHTF